MVQLLLGYTAVVLGLFVLSAVMTSLSTTLSGFGIFFSACALGVLAVWWWNEHQWATEDAERYRSTHMPAFSLLSGPVQPDAEKTGNLFALSAPVLEESSFSTLVPRAVALTDRVSAVYPLVAREDIHKIVWMVMVEMCHEQAQAENTRSGRPLPEKTAQTA
jgi:hypothetical protein